MCVCYICHLSGLVDTFEVKVLFYNLQIIRGYEVEAWIQSLPLKDKPIHLSRYTLPETGLAILQQYSMEKILADKLLGEFI